MTTTPRSPGAASRGRAADASPRSDLARRLADSHDLGAVAQVVVHAVRDLVPAESVVLSVRADDQRLRIEAVAGVGDGLGRLVGSHLALRQAQTLIDRGDERDGLILGADPDGVFRVVVAPMRDHDVLAGLLAIDLVDDTPLTPDASRDLAVLVEVATAHVVARLRGSAVRRHDGLLADAFAASPHATAIVALGPVQGRHPRLITNDAFHDLLGHDDESLSAMSWDEVDQIAVRPRGGGLRSELGRLLRGEPRIDTEHELRHRSGASVWARVSIDLLDGRADRPPYALIVLVDTTPVEAERRELRQLAHRDPLTGTLNRRGFDVELRELCRAVRADDVPAALLYCDIDGFKSVNDNYGHATGDRVIVAISYRIASSLRPGDRLARIGGDEFVVLAHGVGADAAAALTDRLRTAVEKPVVIEGGRTADVSLSIGVAIASADHADPVALVREADAAMYEDKARRREHPSTDAWHARPD